MAKTYTYEEFRWHFLSGEVRRFDLRKLYDLGRYMAWQLLRETMSKEEKRRLDGGETRQVKEGQIVKILCIKDFDRCSSSYSLRNVA
jgi:hypothetical protein